MSTIRFPSGAEVSTLEPPPPGFDPLKAEEAELLRYGFPPWSSENRQAMQSYEAMMRRLQGRIRYIVPTFRRRDDARHSPLERVAGTLDAGTLNFSNWSGAMQSPSPGGHFIFVEGSWTVPNAYAPPLDGIYSCSTWVGMDGGLSMDVCQAGVETNIFRTPWFAFRETYAYWEWFPEAQIQITNFPVAEGDEIYCHIWGFEWLSTTANIYMASSSGAAVLFTIRAPEGTQLNGDSAEWIVARPEIDGIRANLANYGSVFFSSADAHDDRRQFKGAGSGTNIDMTDGSVISVGILWDPTVIQCMYTGPIGPVQ